MTLISSGFDSDNLIFVPEGEVLSLWDVQSWRRLRLDTRRLTIRPRQATIDQIVMDVEEAVAKLRRTAKAKKKDLPASISMRADAAIASMEAFAAPPDTAIDVRIESPGLEGMTWWVRITDQPTESFFAEDYAEGPLFPREAHAFPIYGSMTLERLGTLEVPFPAEGPNAAFWLVVPTDGALVTEPIPAEEPLPLIREFCGANGVSANGSSVNLTTRSKLAANHSGCTPLSRIGEELYATLYFHLDAGSDHQVCAVLPPGKAPLALQILDRSRFEIVAASEPDRLPAWCVLRRDEDVVHIYHGLEGKESEGQHTMPDLILVTMAGGESDPDLRSQLLQQIVGVTS